MTDSAPGRAPDPGTSAGAEPATGGSAVTIRVALPVQLRKLAGVDSDVDVEVRGHATVASLLDALEARHPQLRGTIRDHATGERRAYVRYYACGRDVSHEPQDTPLPDEVRSGRDVFRVLGAISGG